MNFLRWNPLRTVFTTGIRRSTTVATTPATATAVASTTPTYTISELPSHLTGETPTRRVVGYVKNIRGHTKKLNPIARQIRGLPVNEAMVQLAYSPSIKRDDFKAAIRNAVRHANTFHQLNQDNLLIEQAWTGKHRASPRIRHHSKGRAGIAHKRTSMFSVLLREMTTDETKTLHTYSPSALQKKNNLDPHCY